MSGEHQAGLSVPRKILDDMDLGEIIKTVSAILNIVIQRLKRSRRISNSDMINRDMLVNHMWQSGRFSNSEIGSQVGLTISSVSRRVGIFQTLLDRDKNLHAKYEKFKSIIKV